MEIRRLNDLVLKREYCNRTETSVWRCSGVCYDGRRQCPYWKMEFETLRERRQKEKSQLAKALKG